MKSLKLILCATVVLSFCWSTELKAQRLIDVDRTKYPDYTSEVNPDYSLVAPARTRTAAARPDHVNNAETLYFPPVFNQDGGSCGSASRICYMFSYELASYRNLDASNPANYYPSHFVWLHTNSPSGIIDQGKNGFVMNVGVPSAATYGGQTYSSLFGYQEESNNDFGWMQGYDKWYEAMHNRMLTPVNFPVNVGTEEGREAVKNWLWNHNGDESFHAGGICGIGVASGGVWSKIPSTEVNDAIGVTDMYFVQEWGTQVDHALTIVGYDDRIEFDLDEDGIKGEADADEIGAWIIVNSWGDWCNGGLIYCPYAFAMPAFNNDGEPGNRTPQTNFWTPEIYKVRKDYRPLRTIKLEMDYSRRSEIALSAGISADVNATEPEKTVNFVHFTYAGDGNYGNSNPAPEIPMLGRWADGKLHTEPMEFGYDLTDLTDGYDMNMPLKYFFIINTKDFAQGEGKIYNAAIIDYLNDTKGIETPFIVDETVEIKNAGGKTILSVVVQGCNYHAPQNLVYSNDALSWQAPLPSGNTVTSYNIYANKSKLATVEANVSTYTLETADATTNYAVSAVYADGNESSLATIKLPMSLSNPNVGVDLTQGGFTIPKLFATKYNQATIEYWIKPHSLQNWNQSAGQWEKGFMLHANDGGGFTAGWDTANRINGTSTKLSTESWSHVAIVVDNNKMTVYLNGVYQGSVTSNSYSGIGGFGDLVFSSNGQQNAQNAVYDEIRIWNVARSAQEISANKNVEFVGNVAPKGLIAYYKGNIVYNDEGTACLYDNIGGCHATLHNNNFASVNRNMPTLSAPASAAPQASINTPDATLYVGVPVSLTATYNAATTNLEWTAESAGVENMSIASPTLIFTTAGKHTVTLTAINANGDRSTTTREFNVLAAPAIDATFTMNKENVAAGERVSFQANTPMVGYIYEWSMPGSETESVFSAKAATSYPAKGSFNVTLTVTSPDGTQKSHTETINVVRVAPEADFDVTPGVVVKGEQVTFNDRSNYTPSYWKWLLSSKNYNELIFAKDITIAVDKPGVYDVTLQVKNSAGESSTTRNRALIVCNADSKNGLNFSYDNSTITASKVPFVAQQTAFTIEWWMNSGWPKTFCNGIGDKESTMLLKTKADGQMRLYVNNKYASSSANYVVYGEWHHYAVTFNAGSIAFYRDGVLQSEATVDVQALNALSAFCIGGSKAPFKGSIDEFRVWNTALAESVIRQYANSPIDNVGTAEESHQLKIYYNFNQSGGDVQDQTTNANYAVRSGFGPDGDAWGLSKGVFSLNFEENSFTDVTSSYLENYEKTFSYDGSKFVNNNLSTRTFAIKDWTLENTIVNGNIITGAHVDNQKSNCMTVTTGWDGFATALTDHKVFQTITLPAGYYTFEAEYDSYYEGQCGGSYVVAAIGNTLPVTEDLPDCLAYTSMRPKGSAGVNTVNFILSEQTTVSLGLLVNMNGKLCMTIQRFTLKRSDIKTNGTAPEVKEEALPITSTVQSHGIGTFYANDAMSIPAGVTAYVATTKPTLKNGVGYLEMTEIKNGVIPSQTGVVIRAEEGEYVFNSTDLTGTLVESNLLRGYAGYDEYSVVALPSDNSINYVLADDEEGVKFYRKDADFKVYNNKAYLNLPASVAGARSIVMRFDGEDATGIFEVENGNVKTEIYDLSGRRVQNAQKGIYIVKGKKIVK